MYRKKISTHHNYLKILSSNGKDLIAIFLLI